MAKNEADKKTADLFNEEKKEASKQKKTGILKPIKGTLSNRQNRLLEDALAIENEDAKAANATGYMARALAQATLPHLDPKLPLGQMYIRETGKITLTISPTSKNYGIPYGSIPRLILGWICSETVYTGESTLLLGKSQAEFLRKVGINTSGAGVNRFKDQAMRLFRAAISVEYDGDGEESARMFISEKDHIFWHPKNENERSLWESTLELSRNFADEILKAPVPIDLRVFHALTKSPLAMDIYTWLTYRMFVLQRSGRASARIPWVSLKMQIGSSYSDTAQGVYDFKNNFIKRLREVLAFYPEAKDFIEDDKKTGCLILKPAPLHIQHTKNKGAQ